MFGRSLSKLIRENSVPKAKQRLSLLRRMSRGGSGKGKDLAAPPPAVKLTPQQKKMERSARKILNNVQGMLFSGSAVILSIVFNIFATSHAHLHLVFWYWVHLGEFGMAFSITYSLKVDKTGSEGGGGQKSKVAPTSASTAVTQH